MGSGVSFTTDTPTGGGYSAIVGAGGGNTRIITVPNSSSLESITNQLTVSFWIKGTLANNGNWQRIIQHGTEAQGTALSSLVDDLNNTNQVNVRVDTGPSSGNQNIAAAGSGILDGTWHMDTFVLNNGTWTDYIDGNANVTTGADNAGSGLFNTQPLYMFGGGGNGQFVGELNNVAVWNTPLTAAQALALYQRGLASSIAVLGNLTLGGNSTTTLGGAKTAQFTSIGAIGGITATGPMVMAGRQPQRLLRQRPKPPDQRHHRRDQLHHRRRRHREPPRQPLGGLGRILSVPAGATLESRGPNIVIDAPSAIFSIQGNLSVASGALTVNLPALSVALRPRPQSQCQPISPAYPTAVRSPPGPTCPDSGTVPTTRTGAAP